MNGTSYTGIRGRTTGAPQNHWFGPSGDPRGAGIGTPEVLMRNSSLSGFADVLADLKTLYICYMP